MRQFITVGPGATPSPRTVITSVAEVGICHTLGHTPLCNVGATGSHTTHAWQIPGNANSRTCAQTRFVPRWHSIAS